MDLEAEIALLRKRHHDLSDVMNTHGVEVKLQGLLLASIRTDMNHLTATTATIDQLRSAVDIMTLKLGTLARDVQGLQDSVTWVVRLVIGTVITSVLGLVVMVAKLL